MTGRGCSSRRRPEVPGKSRQDTDANNHGVRQRHPTVRRDCARLVRLFVEHRPRSVQTTRALFIPSCSGPASANRYGNRYGRGSGKSFGLAPSAEFAHAPLAQGEVPLWFLTQRPRAPEVWWPQQLTVSSGLWAPPRLSLPANRLSRSCRASLSTSGRVLQRLHTLLRMRIPEQGVDKPPPATRGRHKYTTFA
jgi:hypothetical protein